jgi:hypothetical protein
MNLDFSLHPAQMQVFESQSRFKICIAGRRFGKSYLSAIACIVEAMKDTNDKGYYLKNTDVYYIAPTFQQGKDIMWNLLKDLARPLIKTAHENTAVLKLQNGRSIHIKGSDRPDNLRGVGLSFCVLDEYASMKPETWEAIIRPTLADVEGAALFIGTPAGKNHFFSLYQDALKMPDEWETWQFKTLDNPFIKPKEIESARTTMSHELFRQEHEASFSVGSGTLFNVDNVILAEASESSLGTTYMAVDPAGYVDVAKKGLLKNSSLDEFAIAIVTIDEDGWLVEDILTGRWGVREASLQILKAAKTYRPASVGIEKGALRNALMPYLNDQCRRLQIYPSFTEVTHGNQRKTERIAWALQGRLQNERLRFKPFPNLNKFKDQLMDFPNPMAHDDMLDALAYIDQVGISSYGLLGEQEEEHEVLDMVTGF